MLTTILASSFILLVLDAIFLYVMSSTLKAQILDVQRSPLQLNVFGALLCYGFLIFGLYYFILQPKKTVLDAFFLGLVIYGVYETTSYTALKKWRPSTVLIDTVWGGVLFASTTYLTRIVVK